MARPRPTPARRAARLSRDVERILTRLPAVERDVLTRRLGLHDGSTPTRAEVARDLSLGATEVAEIEQRAIERLQVVIGPEHARAVLARAS